MTRRCIGEGGGGCYGKVGSGCFAIIVRLFSGYLVGGSEFFKALNQKMVKI